MANEAYTLASQICNQISSVFATSAAASSHHTPPLDLLTTEISAVSTRRGRIFIHGVGRELLMLKAFSMRLFHLGLSVHCVGDVTTPPIISTDLLITSAGPGGFSTVNAICNVAKSNGARVLLITAQPESGSCVKYADVICYVPAQTMADDHNKKEDDDYQEREVKSGPLLLPMGSLYEGALFVLFEMVVFKLAEILKESPVAVRSRHTNLE